MLPRNFLLPTVVIFIGLIPNVLSIDPLSGILGIGAVVSAIYSAKHITCYFSECCQIRWIPNNITALQQELDKRVYGQHLVRKVVVSHVSAHVQQQDPHKALTLSFHGPTGTGKNHVSNVIAQALYRKGLNSGFVRLIVVTKEFPHQHRLAEHKKHLRNILESQVKKCPQSLFIFDEIDKMSRELIDTLRPYLDHHQRLDEVDYRHAVFIFLSNTGSELITNHLLQRWTEGVKREDIGLPEMEKVLAKAAVNSQSKGDFWHSELVSKHLITAFVPFLPLEKTHVRQCIRDTMVARRHYSSWHYVPILKVEEVMSQLTFYPQKEQLFSVTGCKRVAEKVNYVMY